jgi:hypothetical protein
VKAIIDNHRWNFEEVSAFEVRIRLLGWFLENLPSFRLVAETSLETGEVRTEEDVLALIKKACPPDSRERLVLEVTKTTARRGCIDFL